LRESQHDDLLFATSLGVWAWENAIENQGYIAYPGEWALEGVPMNVVGKARCKTHGVASQSREVDRPMWGLFIVYAKADRSADTYWFDEKPQAESKGSKVLVQSGTIDGKELEVWLNIDNIAA
jgi:hypothetical protein